MEAHSLAKHALSLEEGRHVWFINPPDAIIVPMNILNQESGVCFALKNPRRLFNCRSTTTLLLPPRPWPIWHRPSTRPRGDSRNGEDFVMS
jgi:hypothetical protein